MEKRKGLQVEFKLAGNPLGDAHPHPESELSFLLGMQTGDFVRHLRLSSGVRLIAGEHSVGASGRSAQFGVEPDTNLELELDVRAVNNAMTFERAKLEFSRPIHLQNVFTTIDEFSVLLAGAQSKSKNKQKTGEDSNERSGLGRSEFISKASAYVGNNARTYLGKLADTSVGKFLKDAAERNHLNENVEKTREKSKALLGKALIKAEEGLDSVVEGIYISELEILTRHSHLVFSLTGEVAMGGRLRWSFDQVQLPDILVPSFDSNLSVLVTQFCVDREQGGNMARTILAMVESFHGQIGADLQFSPIPVSIDAREGRRFLVHLQTQRVLNLLADFDIIRKETEFEFDTHVQFSDKIHTPCCAHASMKASTDSLLAFGQALGDKDWIISLLGSGRDIRGIFELEPGFELHPEWVRLCVEDDYIKDVLDLRFMLGSIPLEGKIDWGVDCDHGVFHVETYELDVSSHVRLERESPIDFYDCETQIGLFEGDIKGHLVRGKDEKIRVELHPELDFDIQSMIRKIPIPEFGLNSHHIQLGMHGALKGGWSFHIDNATEALFVIELDDSRFKTVFREFTLSCDRYFIHSEDPIELETVSNLARISISGLSQCVTDLSWSMKKSPILESDGRHALLLPNELLDNEITVKLGSHGELSFKGGHGFYDDHFFNALVKPSVELEKLAAILNERAFWAHLRQIAEVAIFPFWSWTRDLADRFATWKNECEARGILSIRKLYHMPTLAVALSLLFFNNEDSADEFLPTLNRIMHAQGIDRYKIEELIDRAFPNTNLDNLGAILRWVHKVFSPVHYERPEVTHRLALCDEPAYLQEISMLPTANELYDSPVAERDLANRFMNYAGGYQPEQIEWLLHHRPELFEDAQMRVKVAKLLDIKKRILNLEPREGTFFIQDFNIDVFLDLLLSGERECLQEVEESNSETDISKCFCTWLAPIDLARLISAGISSRYHGLFVQLNQARLFDYLISRGKTYAMAVMYEIGQHSTRALVGMLMGWLSQEQNLLRNRVDREKALTELTGIAFPKPEDYAPWSTNSSGSYIGRIFEIAEQIVNSNELYSAALLRMHSYRFETSEVPSNEITPKARLSALNLDEDSVSVCVDALEQAIVHADELTRPMISLEGTESSRFSEAQAIWQSVIEQAKALIKVHPRAWELPVMNGLYQRVYEGLRVAAVEDELLENVDFSRGWFAHFLGLPSPDDVEKMPRNERIEGIVRAAYAVESDHAPLLADPLIWFVPRPRKSPIDLTLITAMGVITAGEAGHELDSAFRRLKRDYGLKVVRTDTGTVKPIDYNADKIVEEIEKITGPYIMLGYSQGGANMMYTESRLRGGTPEMQHLLDNLVSRCFLCSCFNGSSHAICGVEKYRLCMIDGEGILKTVSTRISKSLSRFAFKALHSFLDMPLITGSLASVECLSHEGLANLSRDAQYRDGVIDFETHGIARTHVPEALYFMYYNMKEQDKEPNDSQVDIYSSCGYPRFNHNESVDILKTQIVPSKLLDMHHWSMLREEIALAETDQDIAEFAYRSPNSLYIRSWIESLILFEHVTFLS
ncbi:MAG: hypothetical protein J6A01_01430 [Proteobacteria bacterium]|nr:hypothetical protein [Pseudomonadota bacterium]